ncbi:MAG: iron chelate uptake ABC transporter family permease subunit [Candidatus Hydrothermia bacterium]|nr:iron chelate uptake ABC transporter family permease subunit [Candidatus Hydrothermia bacterium]
MFPTSIIFFIFSLLIYFLKTDFSLLFFSIHKLMIILITGISLSISGLILQNLLKNPLVEPYILGISSISALGFVLSIILNLNVILSNLLMLALVIICFFAIILNYENSLKIILIGLSINMLSSSLISFLMAISKQDIFKTIFILWGNVDRILRNSEVIFLYFCFIVVILISFWLFLNRKKLLLLSLSDEEALSFGFDVKKYKRIFLIISFILTSISVYFSGIIGFIGLIIPHISKMLNGDNYAFVIIDCIGLSISFIIFSVLIFKFFNLSLPIGIITSIIGTPIFIMMLSRRI